jgi:hypothetical protein
MSDVTETDVTETDVQQPPPCSSKEKGHAWVKIPGKNPAVNLSFEQYWEFQQRTGCTRRNYHTYQRTRLDRQMTRAVVKCETEDELYQCTLCKWCWNQVKKTPIWGDKPLSEKNFFFFPEAAAEADS